MNKRTATVMVIALICAMATASADGCTEGCHNQRPELVPDWEPDYGFDWELELDTEIEATNSVKQETPPSEWEEIRQDLINLDVRTEQERLERQEGFESRGNEIEYFEGPIPREGGYEIEYFDQ